MALLCDIAFRLFDCYAAKSSRWLSNVKKERKKERRILSVMPVIVCRINNIEPAEASSENLEGV